MEKERLTLKFIYTKRGEISFYIYSEENQDKDKGCAGDIKLSKKEKAKGGGKA